MPSELLESELFGYEPGAFTGAVKAKPGKFELCNKGTILLDEIGEMSPALQAKLLQVLQDGQFSRLGGRHSVKVDVRVLAATNINMAESIAKKTFREDLYYRLSSFVMSMPSLRQRKEEISDDAAALHDSGGRALRLPAAVRLAAIGARLARTIPGRAISASWKTSSNATWCWVTKRRPSPNSSAARPKKRTSASVARVEPQNPDLKQMVKTLKNGAEMEAIANALEENGWNRKRAASMLNISYKALLYKIRQYDIRPRRSGRNFVPSFAQELALRWCFYEFDFPMFRAAVTNRSKPFGYQSLLEHFAGSLIAAEHYGKPRAKLTTMQSNSLASEAPVGVPLQRVNVARTHGLTCMFRCCCAESAIPGRSPKPQM